MRKRTPTQNGYIMIFYVLGNKKGNCFVNHNKKSKLLITDPMRAIKFDTWGEALNWDEQNKNNYIEEIYVHEIKVTIELSK